jgi:formylglycine-generating enzyme required for sulfatase activity
MRKWLTLAVFAAIAFVIGGGVFAYRLAERERLERFHYEREETLLMVANLAQAPLRLFKSRGSLADAEPISRFEGSQIWLPTGDYFVEAELRSQKLFYPVTVLGYRSGPDLEGSLTLTIRPPPADLPPTSSEPSTFVFIPSGSFVIGDRRNPRQPHHAWIQGFFMNRFEVSNAEFRAFLRNQDGYPNDANWSEAGRQWRSSKPSEASAQLRPEDAEYARFGQSDQPVTGVNWYEASAYCRWLTRTLGKGWWLFALPTEGEWEKAARGPDSFDYGLSRLVSDEEVDFYNWKKNPSAEVTVVGFEETRLHFTGNRYGLYHMSGNVAEWTATLDRTFSRDHPYLDNDGRNREDAAGRRVVRGGSWYSASIAILYLPYRETFQPEVSAAYLGFRIVAKPLP